MLGSIRVGVKASLSASHLMVFLGDQPGISFKLIQQLCRVPEGNQQLVQPADASGRGGHPVLIPQCFFQKVMSSYEGKGLRGLFREHASSVLRISVNDPSCWPIRTRRWIINVSMNDLWKHTKKVRHDASPWIV